jgi:hypothetical protein
MGFNLAVVGRTGLPELRQSSSTSPASKQAAIPFFSSASASESASRVTPGCPAPKPSSITVLRHGAAGASHPHRAVGALAAPAAGGG